MLQALGLATRVTRVTSRSPFSRGAQRIRKEWKEEQLLTIRRSATALSCLSQIASRRNQKTATFASIRKI